MLLCIWPHQLIESVESQRGNVTIIGFEYRGLPGQVEIYLKAKSYY